MPPLPGWDRAEIPRAKFVNYSLDPRNPNNRLKWLAFAALGYGVQEESAREAAANDLILQLRDALPSATAVPARGGPLSEQRWLVRIPVRGPNRREGTLHTVWQLSPSGAPRLITNWLAVRREQPE